jgi:simple sugar transport system permease protein
MNIINMFFNILPSILMVVAPVLIAAAGGMVSERAGVANIALEGLMGIGAMAAAASHALLESATILSIPLALIIGAVMGALFSLVHAFASISLRANQIVSGTGINLLSTGLTVFLCQIIFHQERTKPFRMGMLPGLGGIYPTAWISFAVVLIVWFLLYRRPWGLQLRCCGEHPHAAASMGIDVIKLRYIAVGISGLLAGLAGACLVLTQTIQYTVNTINGKGFIALAAVCFGRWLPQGITGASILFGASVGLAIYLSDFILFKFLPPEFFNALPYLITLVTLTVFSGKDYSPRAVGQPFDKGKR